MSIERQFYTQFADATSDAPLTESYSLSVKSGFLLDPYVDCTLYQFKVTKTITIILSNRHHCLPM